MELTKNNKGGIANSAIHKGISTVLFLMALLGASLCLLALLGCSSSDDGMDPNSESTAGGEVTGAVKDENGRPYPSVLVSLSKGAEVTNRATNADGIFTINTKDIGVYEIAIALPLSTKEVSGNLTSVNVQSNQKSVVDFVIQPQPVVAHLNFGDVELLEEFADKDGNTPTDPNEPLFAVNVFDDPIGLLTPIKAPDGHHVTLSEFQTAKGSLLVHCDGNMATVNITLEGMIPNGTYTFWLAYLNKERKVKESVDFMNDFVYPINPPVGPTSGTENIVIAGVDGTINATLQHSSCILTDEVALVIPIIYHINGKTFGGGHIPDPEEMAHMLAYFQ